MNAAANDELARANAALLLEHQHSSRTVNSPRVLWLSPWVRPLARVQAEALRRRGVDVLLVTSDQHPESDAARDYELVLDPRLRKAATWPAALAAWRRVRESRPDVVIAEMVPDPRWIALAGRVPRVQLAHDDRPHDPGERWGPTRVPYSSAGARVRRPPITYSDYVAAAVATRRACAGTRVQWCRFQRPRPGAGPSVCRPRRAGTTS